MCNGKCGMNNPKCCKLKGKKTKTHEVGDMGTFLFLSVVVLLFVSALIGTAGLLQAYDDSVHLGNINMSHDIRGL